MFCLKHPLPILYSYKIFGGLTGRSYGAKPIIDLNFLQTLRPSGTTVVLQLTIPPFIVSPRGRCKGTINPRVTWNHIKPVT